MLFGLRKRFKMLFLLVLRKAWNLLKGGVCGRKGLPIPFHLSMKARHTADLRTVWPR